MIRALVDRRRAGRVPLRPRGPRIPQPRPADVVVELVAPVEPPAPRYIVVDDYLRTGTTVDRIERAIARHLAPARVYKLPGINPRAPRSLTLSVVGAAADDIAYAADLYLGSARIPYTTSEEHP